MPPLEIHTVATYDAFARLRHAATLAESGGSLAAARDRGLLNEQGTRQLWQLLGLLDEEELVVQLPEWLAEEKVGVTDRGPPTTFVGRLARETEKAILLEASAAARPLMSLAHRIHSLEDGLSHTDDDHDRRDWLERRLQEKRTAFEDRDDVVGLRDEWLPKSQVELAVRRVEPDEPES